MANRLPDGEMMANDDSSSPVEIAMILVAACPSLGAMIAAPLVGSSLITLALLDSFLVGSGIF